MKIGYRPDIDGLRAISILAVLVFHAFPELISGGFVGVDVFFVISGYLITKIISAELASGSFSVSDFYQRRIRRIVPALCLVLAGALAMGWFVLLPLEYARLGEQAAASALFVPNLLFWTQTGYFDAENAAKPLLHLWSLGVEEQFYLAWPALLAAAVWLRLRLPWLMAGILLLSLGACIWMTGRNPATAFYLPFFRAWELALGACLVWLPAPGSRPLLREGLALAGIAGLLASVVLIDKGMSFPGAVALAPTLAAALLIYLGGSSRVERYLLGNRGMVFFGKISYPLYLWHWPLLSLSRTIEGEELPAVFRLGIVATSIALAWLSYRFVESPLRRSKRGATALVLLVVFFAIGAVGWLLYRSGGAPGRLEMYREKIAQFDWRQELAEDCSAQLGLPRVCMMSAPRVEVAVLGDSHSTNVYFALAHHYAGSDTGVLRLGRGGCPPLLGVATRRDGAPDECREMVRRHVEYVAGRDEIHTVYLSSMPRYVLPGERQFRMSVAEHPEMDSPRRIYRYGLQATIGRLQAAGKRVVLVMDWPSVTFDPRSCVELRPFRFTGRVRAECSIPRQQFLRSHAPMRRLQREVLQGNPDLYYWDTAQALCDSTTCWVRKGDVMLYRDANHLSVAGARFLGEHWRIDPAAEATKHRGEP